MIVIDKGIPLPKGNHSRYPLGKMEVGDSFFAAGKSAGAIGGAVAYYKPKKFTARTVTENGVKGARVWRIA